MAPFWADLLEEQCTSTGRAFVTAGADGAIGSSLAIERGARGAQPALTTRDPARLAKAAKIHQGAATALFDAYAPNSCARAVHTCAAALGELDAVITAFGTVVFGTTQAVDDATAEHLSGT
ncbi:SDR family NAD(P)-dependent oxidoreductase [Streptomyces sp. NPDC057302]|uniref:SDR family NAD(P)-dependent oxidoreductase n=1 Tax=Streptomyces sp. NPDC057302 TaxID=3346094 RepID=UPI00363AB9F5